MTNRRNPSHQVLAPPVVPFACLRFWFTGVLVLLATVHLSGDQPNVIQTERSVVVKIGNAQLEAAAATETAFRLSISYNGKPQAHQTILLGVLLSGGSRDKS